MMIFKRIIICFLLSVMLLMVIAPAAAAVEEEYSLTIYYAYDDKPIQGARFQIYMVGDIESDGSIRLSGDFENYPVAVNGLNSSGLQAAADTLYAYAKRDQLQPNQIVATNTFGLALVSSLPSGLYLLTSTPRRFDGDVHITQPQLILVTGNLKISPKSEIRQTPPEALTLTVLKKWVDEGYESQRPQSVSVYLLQDGVPGQAEVLNAENNWRYTWQNLDPNSEWTALEECPEDYTVTVQRSDQNTILITNTRIIPPPAPTVPSESPSASSAGVPSIPQTGLVWWPVLTLLAAGILLIVAGVKLRRKECKDA